MGNYTDSYTTVKPLEGSVVDLIGDQEKMDLANKQHQLEVAKAVAAKKEKEDAAKKAQRDEILKVPKFAPTGVQTIETLNAGALRQVVERKGELWKEYNDPKTTTVRKDELLLENGNLDKAPENLMLSQNTFKEYFATYDAAVKLGDEGKPGGIHRDPALEEKRKLGFDAYKIKFDKSGNPMVAFGDFDSNQDGVIDDLDIVPFDNIKNKQNLVLGNGFLEKVDFNKSIATIAEKAGIEDLTDDKGNYISTQNIAVDPDKLLKSINSLVRDENGNPTTAAKSRLFELGLPINVENLDKIRNEAYNNAFAQTNKTYKKDIDYGSKTARMAEGRQQRKDDEEKASYVVTTTVPPIYAENNIKIEPGYNAVALSKAKTIPSFRLKVDGKTTQFNNATPLSYAVARNPSGVLSIAVEMNYQKETGKTEKYGSGTFTPLGIEVMNTRKLEGEYVTQVVYMPETEADKIGLSLDLPGKGEMINKMKSIAKDNGFKKFSDNDERKIKLVLDKNPGYTRQEVVKALKLK